MLLPEGALLQEGMTLKSSGSGTPAGLPAVLHPGGFPCSLLEGPTLPPALPQQASRQCVSILQTPLSVPCWLVNEMTGLLCQ